MMLPYYYYAIVTKMNSQISSSTDNSKKISRLQRWKNLLQGLRNFKLRRRKILIFSHTLFENIRDGKFVNNLHGSYFDLYKSDTLLMEDSDNDYCWRTRDSYSNLSFVNTFLLLISGICSSILHRIHSLRNDDYQKFVSLSSDLFSYDSLSRVDYYTRIYRFLLKILFKIVKPRIVMVNCGSYGGDMAIVCYVAKQMGIKVIEPQHGSTYHNWAYEVSETVANSDEYKKYLPDVFFAFGDYWLNNIKWHYEKIAVGFQFLNQYVSESKEKTVTHDFLVVSQPIDEFYPGSGKKEFVKELALSYPDSRILFRIHPSENLESQKTIYIDYPNIEVVSSSSVLYEDIMRCRFVIGWFSTCLFEVLAFNKCPIIVDTEPSRQYFPHDVGVWIKKPDELRDIGIDNLNHIDNYEQFWATDFSNNVQKYINKLL